MSISQLRRALRDRCGIAAVVLCLATAAGAGQPCAGDCNGDGSVAIDELVVGVGMSVRGRATDGCAAFDGDGDGRVSVDELVAGVGNALHGCPPDPPATPSASPTPSQTPTSTLTPTPTSTPAPALLFVRIHNPTGIDELVEFSGERLSGPADANGALTYGPLATAVPASGAGAAALTIPAGLAPGVWLHRLRRPGGTPEYAQHQQSLVIADPDAPNAVEWQVFRTVLSVNRSGDDGDGACGATCTLRDAIDTANASPPPVLIRFDADTLADAEGRVHIRIDRNTPLRIRAPGVVLDGRNAAGNPSPLADFADRLYPTTITLVAQNLDPDPTQPCPCRESNGGAIRVQAGGVRLEGLAILRQLAPEGEICCGDQDLVAFDAGSKNSRITTCLLDGGARAISSAQVTQGETHAPTGKDCVDATNTGATAEEPAVVENSELRYCHDRGVKSQSGYLRLERNWIHHNLRGGVFALSPPPGASENGVVDAVANLIEANGRNCPTGDPPDCGAAQHITRTQASEIALQGNLTRLLTAGNVLRDGVLQGMYFQGRSEGMITGDYVCGIANGSGAGIGILVKMNVPVPPVPCLSEDDCESDGACIDGFCVDDTEGAPAVSVRGVTTAYNGDSGVRLNGYRAADFGAGGTAGAGNNAFTDNGFTVGGAARLKRNFVNALLDSTDLVRARGNQWQHCYPANGVSSDLCSMTSISRNDTNNTNAAPEPDRVDPGDPQPHASTRAVEIDAIAPPAVVQGGLVRISGHGFDAISGHAAASRDCTALLEGNRCDPLQGTCVEFFAGGGWVPAEDVLAVTPTHLVVRSPLTCTVPTLVRVRRAVLGGGEVISEPVPFCRN
jgi:CSLREA domain-containing protein